MFCSLHRYKRKTRHTAGEALRAPAPNGLSSTTRRQLAPLPDSHGTGQALLQPTPPKRAQGGQQGPRTLLQQEFLCSRVALEMMGQREEDALGSGGGQLRKLPRAHRSDCLAPHKGHPFQSRNNWQQETTQGPQACLDTRRGSSWSCQYCVLSRGPRRRR